jgi:hypothetical protein
MVKSVIISKDREIEELRQKVTDLTAQAQKLQDLVMETRASQLED